MQKYVLVKFLKDIDEGTEFSASNWPLHVTIAPRFVVAWEKNDLFEKLNALLAKHKPIDAIASKNESFGPQKQIKVTVLDMTLELKSLHNDVIALLKSVGAVFDEPLYIEEGYRAHVTIQPNAQVSNGDRVHIDSLTIVDMFPHNDINQRKVLRTIKFSRQ